VKLPELKGKVLFSHCYPERCHGEVLINWGKNFEVEDGIQIIMGLPLNGPYKNLDKEEECKITKRQKK